MLSQLSSLSLIIIPWRPCRSSSPTGPPRHVVGMMRGASENGGIPIELPILWAKYEKMMGFVSNPLNFRGLGYQGKHQIYFQTDPAENLDLLILEICPQKNVPFTNTSRSCAAMCDVWNKHKRVCLKLGHPQIWWLRWISCSPSKLQLWGMRYTGIPTFRHTQIRLGQLLLDAEGVQLGRRGVLSPAMGPLDKSTCCVFSGNCLKNVGRSTSVQPGLLMSSPTKLSGLRVWETSSLWEIPPTRMTLAISNASLVKKTVLLPFLHSHHSLFATNWTRKESTMFKTNKNCTEGKHFLRNLMLTIASGSIGTPQLWSLLQPPLVFINQSKKRTVDLDWDWLRWSAGSSLQIVGPLAKFRLLIFSGLGLRNWVPAAS